MSEVTKVSIRKLLLKEMMDGMFSNLDRLPRETVLSEVLGISRTQLRDELAQLEREGFITRRHGVGTLINRHVLNVSNRMDIETEFLEIIEKNGYKASIGFVKNRKDQADHVVADKLHLSEQDPVIHITYMALADDMPAIFCEDFLDYSLLKNEIDWKEKALDIFQFLEKYTDKEAYLDLTEIHPVAANQKLAEILQVQEGTPLLYLEELDYDIDGVPVFYSKQYFRDEFFRHTVMRKKI